jgi:gamma-glutamyltranspeptidase/glutathione hydrolase
MKFFKLGGSFALLSLLLACTPLTPTTEANAPPAQGKAISGQQGMVVTAHPAATLAATRILQQGGNAADAAVAAGFAISVVEPTMNSIGGRSQILLRKADGTYFAINGMTEIPASYSRPEEPEANGYTVIATPGVVAALARVHQEHGSLPWADLVQPAIELAEQGVTMLPGAAARHERGLEAVQSNPGFAQNILVDGKTLAAGETLQQPNLGATLRKIAKDGAETFYRGEIANVIAKDMAAHGGYVTLEDLANYKAIDGRYVTVPYRGYEIHTIAAPAGGGLVVKALNILENFPLSEMNDLEWAAIVNQALAISIRTMNEDYEEADLELVTSKDWAKAAAAEVTVPKISVNTAAQRTHDTNLVASVDWSGASWGEDSHHTTHFVTADCAGMAVSITQTIGPLFGSKVMTPELGFPYASTMGTYLSTAAQSPGSRPRTTIAPTVVTRDGDIVMVLGAAGGLRILSGIVQTISRFIDQGMDLPQAVAAPRIHPSTKTNAETRQRTVELLGFHAEQTPENGWSEQDVASWQAAGFTAEPNIRSAAFARVHALGKSEQGWIGAADLDWEGTAATPNLESCSIR